MTAKWIFIPIMAAAPAVAQVPRDLVAERTATTEWLATGKATPATIVALSPIGVGQRLRIGAADSDLPIPGFDPATVSFEGGKVFLEGKGGKLSLPPAQPVPYGAFLVEQDGPANRRMIAVYGPERRVVKPEWYPYAPKLQFTVSLDRSSAGTEGKNLLAFDGVETPATMIGTVSLSIEGQATVLKVYRFGSPDEDEPDIEIYFQDGTNDAGTYPAGRFVELRPVAGGTYQLDFNRARNPFCAYRTVYPCPIPWPGNLIKTRIVAGEKYVHAGP